MPAANRLSDRRTYLSQCERNLTKRIKDDFTMTVSFIDPTRCRWPHWFSDSFRQERASRIAQHFKVQRHQFQLFIENLIAELPAFGNTLNTQVEQSTIGETYWTSGLSFVTSSYF